MHPPLPEPRPDAGRRPTLSDAVIEAAARDAARRLSVHLDDPTVPSWAEGPRIGTAPPVAQPGRPPMSQRAVDVSGVMLAAGAASVPLGGVTCLVLWTLNQVDPLTLAIGGTAPVAFVFAVGAVLRRARPEPEVHHHFEGPVTVDQRTVQSRTTGVWARTDNQQ